MDNKYYIKGTNETPEITFDRLANSLTIQGVSMPENALDFYLPALAWLENLKKAPNAQNHLVISLDYFNSGSVKQIFKMMCLMEEMTEFGKEAKIIWNYKKGDELMQSKGIEFGKFLDIPVEMVER